MQAASYPFGFARLTRHQQYRTQLAALLLVITGLSATLNAQEQKWRQGLSLFGELKYKPGFKNNHAWPQLASLPPAWPMK